MTKFKEFYEDHSRVIGKLLTNHFGAAFLGLVMALPTSRISPTIYFWTSVLSILFLIYLNHTVLWEDGAKAKIRVDGGREEYKPLTGLLMCLIAEIPAIVLCTLDVIVYLISWENGPFRIELRHWIFTIPTWGARLWQGMFLGFIQGTLPNSHLLLFFSPCVILAGAALSYWCGLKNFHIFSLQEPKKKQKKLKPSEMSAYDEWRARTKPETLEENQGKAPNVPAGRKREKEAGGKKTDPES